MRTFVMMTSLVLAAGCGRLNMGNGGDDAAYVIFRNQSGDQAAVYAVGTSGSPIRIGTVMGLQTDTLRLPLSVTQSGGVRIFADLLARGRTPSTGLVSLGPGEAIDVTLNSSFGALSVLPATIDRRP